VIHVVGYLIVIGVLAGCTKKKHDAEFVFTHFQNSTGWDSDFVSWSVSLLAALYAYFSLDTATHFSEEIPNASVLVPRASKFTIHDSTRSNSRTNAERQ
jgi:choline transport protein